MPRFWGPWGASLALGALLALGLGATPAGADGAAKPAASRYLTDYRLLAEDFQRGGALKFYDDTEDLLRAGQFERAFSRYLFLQTQVRGQALYVGLTAMVDHRLRFLSSQLGLGEKASYHPVSHQPYRKARKKKKAKPACPPASNQKGAKPPAPPAGATAAAVKATAPGTQAGAAPSGEKPPEAKAPAADTGEKPPETSAAPAATGAQAEAPTSPEKAPPTEEAQEEKAKEEQPAPPPSFWEKVKRKAMFWK